MLNESLKKSERIGVIAVIVLNLMDLITTFWALSLGAVEGNPLSQFLIDSHLLIPSKVIIVGLICFAAWKGKEPTVRSNSMLWWVVGVYSLVIVLNTIHLIMLL